MDVLLKIKDQQESEQLLALLHAIRDREYVDGNYGNATAIYDLLIIPIEDKAVETYEKFAI